MIVNHFKMKSSIASYNLSGMGCSAGVISLSLARELLQVYLPLLSPFYCLQGRQCQAQRAFSQHVKQGQITLQVWHVIALGVQ